MNTTAVLLVALAVAPAASADSQKSSKLTPAELQVLAHDHAVNAMEIELGTTATRNSNRAAVREYGEMLVKDHTAYDAQLKALAKRTGQTIPAEKPATDALKLGRLRGSQFDALFLKA